MKLLFVSLMEGFAWGGSEELWSKVAMEAVQQGNEVVISYKYWEIAPPKLQLLIEAGAHVEWRKNKLPESRLERLTKRITSKIYQPKESNNWEWVLTQKVNTVCISLGGAYDIALQMNLIHLLNENHIPYFLIQQFNYENLPLRNKIRWQAKEAYQNAKQVFFVSRKNKETTERNLATRIPNSRIVSNPANLENIVPPPFPASTNIYHFASVARLDAGCKGQDILFEVLSTNVWKNRNWHLHLYGDGPDKQYLEELIKLYHLTDYVSLEGSVTNIKSIWEQNHLLLMPSVAEGTPLALIEAMLCERTAVVTDVGGNTELIDDGISGFVASACTKKLIDDTMERAWEQRTRWQALGKKAREKVIETINLNEYIDIYKELIDQS